MRVAVWSELHDWGGGDTHLGNVISNWSLNDEIVLFINQGKVDWAKSILSDSAYAQISVVAIPFSSSANSRRNQWAEVVFLPFYFYWRLFVAKRLLRKHGPFDAFMANNGGYPGSWSTLASLGAAASLRITSRCLIVLHQAVSRLPFRQTVEQLIDRAVVRWATTIVAISNATRSTLIERRGFDPARTPIGVVWSGVEDSIGTSPQLNLRKKLNVEMDLYLIGTLGRLDRCKGHEELVIALSQVHIDIRSRIVLCIVGGSDSARVEKLQHLAESFGVKSNVIFAGFIDGHPSGIVSQLDLLISANQDFEGFGLTIAEAMLVGTPVIATDVGAVREFFDDEAGILVRPGSIDDLTSAIEIAFLERDVMRSRAKVAQTRVRKITVQKMCHNLRRELLR